MKPCCEKPDNREVVEQTEDHKVERCKVCGAKHYELSVDPIILGVEAAPLG